jgi:serine/threonine protein kinase
VDSRLALPQNTVLDGSYRIERVVGSGGFGITYEAEDVNLGTEVAIKEYYPFDFADRDTTMSVHPRSERHQKTFQWGRSNFLQEARTLAKFEHPSIVRVTRVFEANSTAYMVMRFEEGQTFDDWLKQLHRAPTQEELDAVVRPLLEALQMMHRADFLHRDISPDNIIVRGDGSPVLLDFGAARRAVAEISHSLTGIVKPGYSPHEQYASESRFQGPWTDLYALGGTLYRAVTGQPPEEATLRVDEDRMPPAIQAANGKFRREFLRAIDACLKVRVSERPQSVVELRSKLLSDRSPPKRKPISSDKPPRRPPQGTLRLSTRLATRRFPAILAAIAAVSGGVYGGYAFTRWQSDQPSHSQTKARQPAAEANHQAEEPRRQAELDARERRAQGQVKAGKEAEAARAANAARQAELEAEGRRANAERARKEAQDREEQRQADESRAEAERRRLAALPSEEDRAAFVRHIQELLQKASCYDGDLNGRSEDAQKALDRWLESQKGLRNPVRIELATATVGDFESLLRSAEEIKGEICTPQKPPSSPTPQRPATSRPREEVPSLAARQHEPRGESRPPREHSALPSSGGGAGVIQGVG